MTAFKADGITVQQFNEPAGGQVVFHLHVHVMPRHDGVALLPPASRKEDGKVLEENAAKLIAALKADRCSRQCRTRRSATTLQADPAEFVALHRRHDRIASSLHLEIAFLRRRQRRELAAVGLEIQ